MGMPLFELIVAQFHGQDRVLGLLIGCVVICALWLGLFLLYMATVGCRLELSRGIKSDTDVKYHPVVRDLADRGWQKSLDTDTFQKQAREVYQRHDPHRPKLPGAWQAYTASESGQLLPRPTEVPLEVVLARGSSESGEDTPDHP